MRPSGSWRSRIHAPAPPQPAVQLNNTSVRDTEQRLLESQGADAPASRPSCVPCHPGPSSRVACSLSPPLKPKAAVGCDNGGGGGTHHSGSVARARGRCRLVAHVQFGPFEGGRISVVQSVQVVERRGHTCPVARPSTSITLLPTHAPGNHRSVVISSTSPGAQLREQTGRERCVAVALRLPMRLHSRKPFPRYDTKVAALALPSRRRRHSPPLEPQPPNMYAYEFSTDRVCPERGSGASPFWPVCSHTHTDCTKPPIALLVS